jgi:hypothetical protein
MAVSMHRSCLLLLEEHARMNDWGTIVLIDEAPIDASSVYVTYFSMHMGLLTAFR